MREGQEDARPARYAGRVEGGAMTLTIAPAGIELNEVATCPVGLNLTPGGYTATATTLAIQKNGTKQLETYTKQ